MAQTTLGPGTNYKYFLLNAGTENERYFIAITDDCETPILLDGNEVPEAYVTDATLEAVFTFTALDNNGTSYESSNGVAFMELNPTDAEFIGIRPPRP
jgi:hypothetical protein